jgi:anti-sigma factor RsiW
MFEKVIGYVHGELAPPEHAILQVHLRECAGCQGEVVRLQKLEDLLRVHLPSISPSPTFASTFANRLAAEIAAEEARRERPGVLGWLTRPWMIPAAALAVLVLAVTYSLSPSPGVTPAKSVIAQSQPAVRPDAAANAPLGIRNSRSESPALAQAPRQGVSTGVVASRPSVPPELIREADAFIDYAIIRELRVLETPGAAPGHTG